MPKKDHTEAVTLKVERIHPPGELPKFRAVLYRPDGTKEVLDAAEQPGFVVEFAMLRQKHAEELLKWFAGGVR